LERELCGTLSGTEIEALTGNDYLNLLAVSYHEGAHFVAGVLAGESPAELGLRCEKRDGSLARIVGHCTMRSGAMTPLIWMSGQAGEELHGFPPQVLGKGSEKDRARADELEDGGSETGLREAKTLLRQHWQAVKWLAIELQHEHVVSGTRATSIVLSALDWDTRHRLQNAA